MIGSDLKKMKTFSVRNHLRREYSGFGEASHQLRYRILTLYKKYSGNEMTFGVGNRDWIHQKALENDLKLHFGRYFPIKDLEDPKLTTYDEVFDFIELLFRRAELDLHERKKMFIDNGIRRSFIDSGSVYEFSDSKVILKLDSDVSKKMTGALSILDPYQQAHQAYIECIRGLIDRSKAPRDVIKDMFLVFEEYSKNISKSKDLSSALRFFKGKLFFHETQIQNE